MGQSSSPRKKEKGATKTNGKKNHGGARPNSGPSKDPNAPYTEEKSKPIRLPREISNNEARTAIEEIYTLLLQDGKDFSWLVAQCRDGSLKRLENEQDLVDGNHNLVNQDRSDSTHFSRNRTPIPIRLFNVPVAASFDVISSENATDGGFEEIDLLNELTQGAELNSTYLLKVVGSSMVDAGINPDDLLVVERINYPMQLPNSGDTIVASINETVTVKVFRKVGEKVYLEPRNSALERIEITDNMDFRTYGIVRSVIHVFSRW